MNLREVRGHNVGWGRKGEQVGAGVFEWEKGGLLGSGR